MPMSRDDLADVLRLAKARSRPIAIVFTTSALEELGTLVTMLADNVVSSPNDAAIRQAKRDHSWRSLPGGRVLLKLESRFIEPEEQRFLGHFSTHVSSAVIAVTV